MTQWKGLSLLLAVVHVTSLKDSKPAKMKPNVGPGGRACTVSCAECGRV